MLTKTLTGGTVMRIFMLSLAGLAILTGVGYWQLTNIPLGSQLQISKNARWYDDYYTIEYIDANTIAIGEPRYYQKNYNYLILGEDRAILFDTGPGVRNIRPLVKSLTSLPITVIASHLHYDHIGNHEKFENVALLDTAQIRKQTQRQAFIPSHAQHLGLIEGIKKPVLKVSEWLTHGQDINLGDRRLTVLHTPGHTEDSVMLFDKNRKQLFVGDFIYEAELFAFLPGSNVEQYFQSTQNLLSVINPGTTLLSAHGSPQSNRLPALTHKDLVDLKNTLADMTAGNIEGEGFVLKFFEVNERISIISD